MRKGCFSVEIPHFFTIGDLHCVQHVKHLTFINFNSIIANKPANCNRILWFNNYLTFSTLLIRVLKLIFPLKKWGQKVAQNAGKNSLTFIETRGENVFSGVLCKETVMKLTFARKIAGFLAKNQPFKGV